MKNYDHLKIEKKWRDYWNDHQIYKTSDDLSKPKQFVVDMFPYPSGVGLHVGHPRGFIATDVFSRMKRMQGFNVLHSMGWDAFGLPAENFAIKNKVHPSVAVEENIAKFKNQLSVIGFDYDWSREINTTDPGFYKWTQWMFIQMYKKGLAYESNEPVNWCPVDKTVLANEDVEADGTCERCGAKVEKRPMRQWVLKITDYADRMLADLDKLPKWPEGVKEAQRNWIGKSEGSEIEFAIKNSDEKIKVFTTRADTLFGVTYIVLAPEHSLVSSLLGRAENSNEVRMYVKDVSEKSDIDRTNAKKEKTGVKIEGVVAINPANGEEIPVWIADYVLASYGTGAVMAVPAHDERDFEFAKKYNLPIKKVTQPFAEERVFYLLESLVSDWEEQLNKKNIKWERFENWGIVVFVSSEKVQDFIPFGQGLLQEGPWYFDVNGSKELIIFKDKIFDAFNDSVEEIISFGKLKNIPEGQLDFHKWYVKAQTEMGILVNSQDFDGMTSEEAKKKITEFVGGKLMSTYRLKDWVFSRQRYWGEPIPMIHCDKCGVVPVPESQLPVMLPEVAHYEPTGTGESPLAAIDSWVNVSCPTCGGAAKRETNTMPQWAGSSWYYLRYIDPHNQNAFVDKEKEKHWMPVDIYSGADHATRHLIYARFWHKFLFDIGVVSTEEPFPRLEFLGYILDKNGKKFSKRDGNGIDPSDVVNQFGADAFRLYEMFIGPFEQTARWDENGMVGTYRFIEKVWRSQEKVISAETSFNVLKIIHKTIQKVENDIENFKFNTAVSSLMILMNEIDSADSISINDWKNVLRILAPFAPHITDELWSELGEKNSIHLAPWPKYDAKLVVDDRVTIGIQINGKVRAEIELAKDADQESVKEKVLAMDEVKKWIDSSDSKEIKKFIYVPNKIISIVM